MKRDWRNISLVKVADKLIIAAKPITRVPLRTAVGTFTFPHQRPSGR